MIPNNPNELMQRCSSELARAAAKLPMPPNGWRVVVDLDNAHSLLERAIQEAFDQGATFGLALAKPPRIELKLCDSSPASAELLALIRRQSGDVTS
jgi:hypothetical protein